MEKRTAINSPLDPPPIMPGPFGLRFSVIDHRGTRRNLAKATWSERFRHSPEVARSLPGLSFKVSTLGLALVVIVCTFALQDVVQRTLNGSRVTAPGETNSITQAVGLFAPFFLMMLFAGASVFAIATRVWIPGVARQWLSVGQCPSCRYTLGNLESDTDGCVVCPECGGAWKLHRLGEHL